MPRVPLAVLWSLPRAHRFRITADRAEHRQIVAAMDSTIQTQAATIEALKEHRAAATQQLNERHGLIDHYSGKLDAMRNVISITTDILKATGHAEHAITLATEAMLQDTE